MFFYTFLPKLINMSLTAGVAVVFVLLARLLLRRMPKAISYALWGVVLFRLLCPVSLPSGLSLLGLLDAPASPQGALASRVEYISPDIVHTENPQVSLPIPGVGEAITQALPQGEEQLAADPLEAPMAIATYVWMAGVLAMGVWGAASYIRLRRRLITASPLGSGVYLADEIPTPFVLGLLRPKIYLPSSLEEGERPYILLHERLHIRRLDHVVKALSFAALCIHWFNPLVWLAFVLAGRDMEMSCDEAVVRRLGDGILADYTSSLLRLAAGGNLSAGISPAFGEGDTGGRIRNLARRKRPAVWAVSAAIAACIILAAALLTNPPEKPQTPLLPNSLEGTAYEVQEWLDYRQSGEMPWGGRREINLDAFPGVTFRWMPEQVEAVLDSGEILPLYSGMPVWSVYFADLTGDGLPELCSALSMGSGIVDDRVILYDYANGASYSLEDRMANDYSLSLEEGRLVVTRRPFGSAQEAERGYLVYQDEAIQILPLETSDAEAPNL